MVVKIYGVRSAYNADVICWYKYKPAAEKARDTYSRKFPDLEYRIVTAYYDNGDE